MQKEIEALVFDAYGTLFDTRSVLPVCRELFPEKAEELVCLWRAKQVEYTRLRSLMGRYQDFWQVTEDTLKYALSSLKLKAEPREWRRLMESYLELKPYPDVREALGALSGYRLAILSNGSPRMLVALVKNSGLEGLFSHVISADEAGIFKPSPRVYELAPRHTGADRESIGFVSSNCWDVIGAKSFGLPAYWVNRENSRIDQLGFKPDFTVNNLAEFASLLMQR